MGRKGVSRRKPHQATAKQLSIDNAITEVVTARRTKESPMVKPLETDNSGALNSRGNRKHSSGSKKNPKKR